MRIQQSLARFCNPNDVAALSAAALLCLAAEACLSCVIVAKIPCEPLQIFFLNTGRGSNCAADPAQLSRSLQCRRDRSCVADTEIDWVAYMEQVEGMLLVNAFKNSRSHHLYLLSCALSEGNAYLSHLIIGLQVVTRCMLGRVGSRTSFKRSTSQVHSTGLWAASQISAEQPGNAQLSQHISKNIRDGPAKRKLFQDFYVLLQGLFVVPIL